MTEGLVVDEPLLHMPMQLPNGVRDLEVWPGEQPMDVVRKFASLNGLNERISDSIMKRVCGTLDCDVVPPDGTLLFTQAVEDEGGQYVGTVDIYGGTAGEPADQVHRFITDRGLPGYFHDAIMGAVCSTVPCTRREPLLFAQAVNNEAGEFVGTVEIYGGAAGEPTDQVYNFVTERGLPEYFHGAVVEAVCEAVPCARLEPMIFSQAVNDEGGQYVGTIEIYADGREPADQVHRFVTERELPFFFVDGILNAVCATVPCARREPLLFSQAVNNEAGEHVGTVEIFSGAEPADQVYRFVGERALPDYFHHAIVDAVCAAVPCARREALLYSKPLVLPSGAIVTVDFYSDQEPASAVQALVVQHQLPPNYFESILEDLCASPLVACDALPTTSRPVIFSTLMNDENNTALGELQVHAGEEPTDAAWRFVIENDQPTSSHWNILMALCAQPALLCQRETPRVAQLGVNGPGGNYLGEIDLYGNRVPAEVVADFCEPHGLGVDFQQHLLDTLCEIDLVAPLCTRRAAGRVLWANSIQDEHKKDMGVLEIAEGQEIADAVFDLAMRQDPPTSLMFRKAATEKLCNMGLPAGIRCTRHNALVASRSVKGADGAVIGHAVLWDGMQAADVAYDFVWERGLGFDHQYRLFYDFCDDKEAPASVSGACTEVDPVVWSVVLNNDATGGSLGTVKVVQGQEPVDAVYAFMLEEDLIKRDEEEEEMKVLEDARNAGSWHRKRRTRVEKREVVAGGNHSACDEKWKKNCTALRASVDEEEAKERDEDAEKRETCVTCTEWQAQQDSLEGCNDGTVVCKAKKEMERVQERLDKEAVRRRCEKGDGEACDAVESMGLLETEQEERRKNCKGWRETCEKIEEKDRFHAFMVEMKGEGQCLAEEEAGDDEVSYDCWLSFFKAFNPKQKQEAEEEERKSRVDVGEEKRGGGKTVVDLTKPGRYRDLVFDELCRTGEAAGRINCKRDVPRPQMFELEIEWMGYKRTLPYYRPPDEWVCEKTESGGSECHSHFYVVARDFCQRLWPPPRNCERDMVKSIDAKMSCMHRKMQDSEYDDHYMQLEILKDASMEEVEAAFRRLKLKHPAHVHAKKAKKLEEAYEILSDPDLRHYNDLPCEEIFGMCGKRQPDGGLSVLFKQPTSFAC